MHSVRRLSPVFHDGASEPSNPLEIRLVAYPLLGCYDLRLRDSAGIRPASPQDQNSLRHEITTANMGTQTAQLSSLRPHIARGGVNGSTLQRLGPTLVNQAILAHPKMPVRPL